MKAPERLHGRDFARSYEPLLHSLLGRVPSLKLLPPGRVAGLVVEEVDGLTQVKAGNRKWTLLVKAKRLGQPREVRAAVLQLQQALTQLPGRTPRYGVLLAPFISPESARICAEAGIGYADFADNARLAFGEVFIELRGPGNFLYEKRAARSLFAPRAACVLRVLLQGPLRAWKVAELATSAQVSLGGVSAVRQQLLAREWAVETTGGLLLTKPGAVLEAWVQADDWAKRTTTREYSLLGPDPVELATRVHSLLGGSRHAFTQWIAATLRHPYTAIPLVTVYVTEFPDEVLLKDKLLARRVDSSGRLRLVLPKDEGVLNPLQTAHGLPLVCDVQLYLDLQNAGLRADASATELRAWPDFAGGWA